MRRATILRRAPSRAGFTLLELVVTLALIAILTGVLTPSVTTMLGSRARRATVEELKELSRAAAEHFDDTGTLPAGIGELSSSSAPGWAGPYLLGTVDDSISGGSGYLVDAWSRAYRVTRAGDTLEIRSAGKDGAFGGADDLFLVTDVTPVRRAWTVERLEVVNTAVQVWNARFLATDPLPASYPVIYAKLTSAGYLPLGAGYDVDGWGDAFVPDPIGAAPVVRVGSTNL